MNRNLFIAGVIAGLLAAGTVAFCQFRDRPMLGTGRAETGEASHAGDNESPIQTEGDLRRDMVAEPPARVPDAAPAETTGSLRIRVVDATRDAPVAGIGLVLRELNPETPSPRWVRAVADEKGEAIVNDLPPGSYRLGTDRYHSSSERVEVVAGEETLVTLTLDDCIHLTGMVVDAAGTPVAGAAVLLRRLGTDICVVVTHSAEDGRFAIPAAPRIAGVAARSADHAPSPFRVVTAGVGAEVDVRIVLPGEGGTVSGVVLDPEGRGVAGALVSIGPRRSTDRVITLPDGAKGLHPLRPRTRSDQTGRFVVEGIEPGRQPVTVRTETFAPWSGGIDVVAHRDTPMTIHLAPGVVCEGTMRSETGELLADVRIRSGAAGSADGRDAFTDADGAFRLTGLTPDEILTVVADGDENGRASTEIQGRPGETVVWNATLERGLVLRGRVLGRNGQPLEGAFLMATARSFGEFTKTDADGAFELAACPEGEDLTVEVTAKGYAPLRRHGVDPTSGPILLQMVYEGADVRIVGRIVGPDGVAVGDAQISVGRDGRNAGTFFPSGADGEIAIDGVRPGLLQVRIRAGTFAQFVSEERRVGSGETWNLGTVPLSRGGLLEVRLQRVPATEDARIYAAIHRGGKRLAWLFGSEARSDPMRSDPLAPGDYELHVWGPAVAPLTLPFSIQPDQTTRLDVRPEPAPSCAVTMTVPEGREDVRRVHYRITKGEEIVRSGHVVRRQDGTYGFETGLEVGSYDLHAWTDDGLRGQLAFDVEQNSETRLVRLSLR